ncbi:protein kinase protein [Trichomonas vaginalis G3]|nr:protein kinase protein [Trichomonas vaginalis G3]KAI5524909.1 protein kinase protein [Trichomonas vaginalis G3]
MISGIRSVEDLGKLLPQFVVHNEDFQFVKSIGKGGFSEVFSASYTPTKQMCAVKKLKFRDLSGKNFEALSRELQILSKNAHPYLLGFVGFSIDRPFIIVTEYLPNGSLFDALRWKDNHKP